jgi:ArsR family transcriptional regulator
MIIKLSRLHFSLAEGRGERSINMDLKEITRISKALSDPTRLQIFERIASRKNKNQEMFCGQVVEECKLTPGTISHHLKILADANLISTRRQGQFIYLRPKPETLREYTRALIRIAESKKAKAQNRSAGSRLKPGN